MILQADYENTGLTIPPLCDIKKSRDMYELVLPSTQSSAEFDDLTWRLLHNYQQTNDFGYRIREGDVFKFGKYILKVRQLRIKKDSQAKTITENKTKTFKQEDEDVSRNMIFPKEVIQINSKEPLNIIGLDCLNSNRDKVLLLNEKPTIMNKTNSDSKNTNDKDKSLPICRICLSDEHDQSHPLINPCKCSGTMKFIHLDCLKSLIQSKITEKVNGCVTVLTFKNLECELCHTLFPEKIKVKDVTYSIIDLHRPNTNYILLEGIMKEAPEIKTIYIVSFNKEKKVKIGRASDSDFRLSDISVSRNHAQVMIHQSGYYLFDTKSKFGSLIKAYKTVGIFPHKTFVINKNKICISFKMKLKFWSLLLCYKPKKHYKSENDYYDEQYNKEEKVNQTIPDFLWLDTREVSLFDSGVDKAMTIDICKKV